MGVLDLVVFVGFIAIVLFVGLYMSRDENADGDGKVEASDYFLAGRGLTWWLVGFSLIAANISTEQFVGMSGQAADWLGMAIASYEWMAAVTLVVVAFVFLPKFLKSGIYTIPEFLEYRYNAFARTVMAIVTMIILVGVPTASVIYSGAKVISVGFQDQTLLGLDLSNITVGCWIIGLLAAGYVFAGGLRACAWADLIQGAALIVGGAIVVWLALSTLQNMDATELAKTARDSSVTASDLEGASATERFWKLNEAPLPEGKLHMVRPKDDPAIPWTALVVGLWIPNFFYWGLNQYITQRTLGSKSLAEGQKGVVFAAFLKLIIPFVVVIPGILAFNLFSGDLASQAVGKNEAVLADFENGVEKVYEFNAEFVDRNPELAQRIAAANAALVGGEAPPADFTSAELAEANDKFVSTAKDDTGKSLEISQKLVGYDFDAAFPTLLRNLLPSGSGLKGFVYAAIFGAVVSSLASMLNSASTIATMDLYRKVRNEAGQGELVTVGRMFTVLFVLIAVLIAPSLDNPAFGGIFTFIQEFQGFISPGVLAIFIFGLVVHRAPRACGTVGLLLCPILFGLFKWGGDIPAFNMIPGIITTEAMAEAGRMGVVDWSFLDRMALTFGILIAVLATMTLTSPLKEPVELPVNPDMDITGSSGAKLGGILVVILTGILYYIFW